MKIVVLTIIFFISQHTLARSLVLNKYVKDKSYYRQLVNTLVKKGYYFTAIPFIKEILANGGNSVGPHFEKIITKVGVMQFETLPESILIRSNHKIIRYIRAKKLFRKQRYQDALEALRGISIRSSIGPFAYMLKGSIYALRGDNIRAIDTFGECADNFSSQYINSKLRKKQYEVTRDYCTIGKARALFSLKKYKQASSAYLDLDKSSFVWPEILIEEAWSSFYQKDYNRTLGKLVTYKAPIFRNFFIPEISILESLAYMELCLWADAKKTIDQFEKNYFKKSSDLGRFLKRKGKDFDYFYYAAKRRRKGSIEGGELYNDLLRAIIFEPGFQELYDTARIGVVEFNRVKRLGLSQTNRIILNAIKDTLKLQKRLIGSYVRRKVLMKYNYLQKSFVGMSYIKLEILKRNKRDLYYNVNKNSQKRGDIKYLRRSEKQYFWGFNGEFWADEIGDYVFALPSACER